MDWVGYFLSVFIGIILGLIGGGGSIMTVPVLVYVFRIDAVLATSYSLFVVGFTSLAGSMDYFKHHLVNLKTAFLFGLPSIFVVFVTRAYIVPAIPEEIIHLGSFLVTKSAFLLLFFAILMISASYHMIKKDRQIEKSDTMKINYSFILLQGSLVGLVTGLVGAGGGFLIIPALVVFSKLPMKEAIGTSLLIIASNSLIGFSGELHNPHIDWKFLLTISAFALSGMFIGLILSRRIDGNKLKPAFGWFVLIMGLYIIMKETFLK